MSFKEGDVVKMYREPTLKEWERIGQVPIDKVYGKEFRVRGLAPEINAIRLNMPLEADSDIWYPEVCFRLVSPLKLRDVVTYRGDPHVILAFSKDGTGVCVAGPQGTHDGIGDVYRYDHNGNLIATDWVKSLKCHFVGVGSLSSFSCNRSSMQKYIGSVFMCISDQSYYGVHKGCLDVLNSVGEDKANFKGWMSQEYRTLFKNFILQTIQKPEESDDPIKVGSKVIVTGTSISMADVTLPVVGTVEIIQKSSPYFYKVKFAGSERCIWSEAAILASSHEAKELMEKTAKKKFPEGSYCKPPGKSSYIRVNNNLTWHPDYNMIADGINIIFKDNKWAEPDDLEHLLAEAERRFPSGCSYTDEVGCTYKNVKYEKAFWFDRETRSIALASGQGLVYRDGRWYAKLIEKPDTVTDPLKKAEKLFPKGTSYYCAEDGSHCVVGGSLMLTSKGDITDGHGGYVYYKGKWAKVKSEPIEMPPQKPKETPVFDEKAFKNKPFNQKLKF